MLKLDIETIVEPFVSKKRNINLVVGVINGDLHSILGFSGFSEPSSSTPDGDTLFEIGSITKVFTSTLLSILVEDGQLELKNFIGNLITKYEHLPRNITLESLATHTSGLPRLPSNLMKSAQKDPENPYAAYTIENLDEYLRSYDGKNVKTLGIISYSNLGVGLLGHILAHNLEISYEEAIVSRICNPLTLSNTRITLTDEQQARLAIGRSSKGKPVKNWDLPTFAGAGALKVATERCRRSGANRVEFHQLNLCDAAQLAGEFDLINCVGVLHHLPDPMAGIKSLAAKLAVGGLLHIFVYAELGRWEIQLMQQAIALLQGQKRGDYRDGVKVGRQLFDSLPENNRNVKRDKERWCLENHQD
ncbi:MAG: serine hydrolase, partial [Merismopedia sp. SIO2A8]|nr:serine hydrolase [Merismopedia sp. SIO2A8]